MAKWKPEDYERLAGQSGFVEVPVWSDLPPVVIDARGYQALALLGDIPNPLLVRALDALLKDDEQRLDDDGREKEFWRRATETAELQDDILTFLLREPKYAPKSKYVDGKIPRGCVGYYSFTGAQRRSLVEFLYSGMEAMLLFRPGPGADEHAARDGVGPGPAAEQPGPVSTNGAASVVARRGGGEVGRDAPAHAGAESEGV